MFLIQMRLVRVLLVPLRGGDASQLQEKKKLGVKLGALHDPKPQASSTP